jgi:hypothetical protein
MFRFAARNEKAIKPLKTNDHAKSLVAFRFARRNVSFEFGSLVFAGGPKRCFSFATRQQPMSAMGPNERKKLRESAVK